MEQPPIINESIENKGKNVEIIVEFLRHGERDKDGRLTEYGKEITQKKALEDKLKYDDNIIVKPIGSEAGKHKGFGARALETAEIRAHGIDPDTIYNTRAQNALSYETLLNPVPYDHVAIYNANLPENYDKLSDEEKSEAAKIAQKAVLDYSMSLETPEAIAYRKESAGAFAFIIKHYEEVAKRLKNESKILLPAGTHGGIMEMLLKYALVQEDEHGNKKVGFSNIDEIGGEFAPSESYNVDINTNKDGEIQKLLVKFDNNRPISKNVYLDRKIVDELVTYYKSLHFIKENE